MYLGAMEGMVKRLRGISPSGLTFIGEFDRKEGRIDEMDHLVRLTHF